MSVVNEDWSVLLSLFPADWEELGRKTGAVTRLRGFDDIGDVLRTLLMHVGTGWSLRETAVRAKLAGIAEVSDVTLLNRCANPKAGCVSFANSCGKRTDWT